MRRSIHVLLAASTFSLAVAPSILAAQAVPGAAAASLPHAHGQVLSVQPLSAMFTVYSGEVERKLTSTTTLGIGGTYWGDGTRTEAGDAAVHYASGDVKLRYYPGASPFQGFSFGAQAGYTRVSGRLKDDASSADANGSAGGPTFGVMLDYNWLLGPTRAFYVGLGLGAKALFIDKDAIDDATLRYPTARVSIGRAF